MVCIQKAHCYTTKCSWAGATSDSSLLQDWVELGKGFHLMSLGHSITSQCAQTCKTLPTRQVSGTNMAKKLIKVCEYDPKMIILLILFFFKCSENQYKEV